MKQLLHLSELGRQQIAQIVELANRMRGVVTSQYKKSPQLLGHGIALLWSEQTDNQAAFSLAAQYLSANVLNVDISFGNPAATAQMLTNMGVDVIVAGSANDEVLALMADKCDHLLCGGTKTSDPAACIADLVTLLMRLDSLQNLKVAAFGNKNIAKLAELQYCLEKYNSELVWYLPSEAGAPVPSVRRINDVGEALSGADAVIDLGLQPFCDGVRYYGAKDGIPESLLKKAAVAAPLLGCETIVGENGKKAYEYNEFVNGQVNLVAAAMALLLLLPKL